jgi:hypothetical protein
VVAFTDPVDALLTTPGVVELMTDQFPSGGKVVQYQVPELNSDPSKEVGAFFRYDDGHGIASIQFALRKEERPFPFRAGQTPGLDAFPWTCTGQPPRPSGPSAGPLSCQTGYLPDGSWEMVQAVDGMPKGLYGYRVSIWRPTGEVLVAAVYNGTINGYGGMEARTRDLPPLSLAQWRSVAESPKWQFQVPHSVNDSGDRLLAPVFHAPWG